MRKPWPRISTDFHGYSFARCRKAIGGTADASRSSEAGQLRFWSLEDSEGVAPRVPSPGFEQLSVPATHHRLPACPRNTGPLSSRGTILAQELPARPVVQTARAR